MGRALTGLIFPLSATSVDEDIYISLRGVA
jgi:hypothetical protein